MQMLDSEGMARIEPALAPRFAQGMYLPGEGQLDNRQLLAALAGEMERLGVQLHWNTPREPAYFARWASRAGCSTAVAWARAATGATARCAWRGGPPARARGHAGAPHAVGAPALPGLHRAQRKPCVRDRRDRDRVRRPLARQRAFHAGTAERRLRRAPRLCRGTHSGTVTQCRPTLPDNLPAVRQLAARACWRSMACTAMAT
jgi:glycine oxidase